MRDHQPQQVFGHDVEFCPQTGRPYEKGSGSHTKEQQTARFLAELSPEEKAKRRAAEAALNAATPEGRA
jgi:hypothetical protein